MSTESSIYPRTQWYTPGGPRPASSESKHEHVPLKFGENSRHAQILQVDYRDIIFPINPTTSARSQDILAFSWKPLPDSHWSQRLIYESLQSLVALSLTLRISPGHTKWPPLHLRMLRYLKIRTWGCNAEYLAQWYFPALQHLSLQISAESTLNIGRLLDRHSATIEELKITGKYGSEALACCPGGLPRLKT